MSEEKTIEIVEFLQDETGDFLILEDKTVLEIVYGPQSHYDERDAPSWIEDVPPDRQEEVLEKTIHFGENKLVRYATDRRTNYHFDKRLGDEFKGKEKELEEIIYEQHEIGNLIDFEVVDGKYISTFEMRLTDRGKNVLELLKTIESGELDQ